MKKAYFSWSSGKDSALALYEAIESGKYKVETLFSSVEKNNDNIAMNETGADLLKKQAEAIGIPLTLLHFDSSWPEESYSAAMQVSIDKLKARGITTALFGDIYLENIKNKRVASCAAAGIDAEFPLWKIKPREIMERFISLGFKAIITCVDNAVLPEKFLGKALDRDFLKEYPDNLDICGENGEYHSFVYDGPVFRYPLEFTIKRRFYREYEENESAGPHRYCYLELI